MEDKGCLRILIIDDNPAIHQDFKKILTSNHTEDVFEAVKSELFGNSPSNNDTALVSFEIDTASQGQEGIKLIRQSLLEGRPYALTFVDIRMPPGWDGIETIKNIWALDRNIQVVICTAYSDYSWQETINELGESDNLLILKKPFDTTAVRQLAFALTKKWQKNNETQMHTESLEQKIRANSDTLKQSMSIRRATLNSASNGIVFIDNYNQIIDYNTVFIEMWMIPELLMKNKNYSAVQEFMIDKQKADNLLPDLIHRFTSSSNESGTHTHKIRRWPFF